MNLAKDKESFTDNSSTWQSSPTTCAHCYLDVPPGLYQANADKQFCCTGCRTAYQIINQSGLGNFYNLREKEDALAINKDEKDSKSFEYFDDENFIQSYAEAGKDNLVSIELYLEGIHCPACIWLVENIAKICPGIKAATLNYSNSRAQITCDLKEVKLSQIAKTLDSLGYTPHPYRSAKRAEIRKKEARRFLAKIAVAGTCFGNIMLLAVSLYAGEAFGIEKNYENLFRWFSFFLTIPVITYSAASFFKGAISSLRLRKIHIDVPISLGIIAAFIASSINTFRGSGHIYFDSVSALVFFLLIGRWLQFKGQELANERTEILYSLIPSYAHKITNGETKDVSIESVLVGDTLQVLPSETLPVDGKIISGSSQFDFSALSGESRPMALEIGSTIHAGVINLSSPIEIEVLATGENTRLGKLNQLVEQSTEKKAEIENTVDRISSYFVFAVISLSAIGFSLGLSVSLEEAISRTIAVLIVSCPCALALATPLAISKALSLAAQNSIFIKNAKAIEALSKANTLVFDKTGTLTSAVFRVQGWVGDKSLQEIVGAIENNSRHVMARAISREYFNEQTNIQLSNIQEIFGQGMIAEYQGDKFLVGNASLMHNQHVEVSKNFISKADSFAKQGFSPIYVARNNSVEAVFALGDSLKDGARELIEKFKNEGMNLQILSGDKKEVVEKVGATLGLAASDCLSEQTPESKLSFIESLNDVVMFGDGVNDAASLKASSVGVAVHGGVEASVVASDVFFINNELALIDKLFSGSRQAMAVVKRNLVLSLIYNLFGATLALFGVVTPLFAAVLMPISSLTVIISSYLQKSFKV